MYVLHQTLQWVQWNQKLKMINDKPSEKYHYKKFMLLKVFPTSPDPVTLEKWFPFSE